jgi:hypothetical protein
VLGQLVELLRRQEGVDLILGARLKPTLQLGVAFVLCSPAGFLLGRLRSLSL